MTLRWSLTLRIVQGHVCLLQGHVCGMPFKGVAYLCLAHVPTVLGLLLLFLLLCSSLWLEWSGSTGRAIAFYLEHVHLKSCPLESEEAVKLAERDRGSLVVCSSAHCYAGLIWKT
ncbi:hypothetical protein TraAM80_04871 [Trypanosoma rangeli]|uniref:Uncharacterized protein n=1 Tax=Trypanosoma rangeli TaxID=5698 RepID=A0A3R7MLG5_TRYRA|nr:uncharacterized protein TraAM80_04871 [Trypanosoma rangeli]RNF04675.1 hypothetical protein TraAM80_04871 [Trypanosoma rangeli]|eukprot:RNF04675.1 hypothetical protein TraAM80_04871 [Trypanosoma rangeli]